MFNGEESIRISSARPREEMEDALADALDALGDVEFTGRQGFRVRTPRFTTSLANVTIEGELTKGRNGQWRVSVTYRVTPTVLCWVIAVIGVWFWFLGLLIFLIPNATKNDVKRAVTRAVENARDDIEEMSEEGERA